MPKYSKACFGGLVAVILTVVASSGMTEQAASESVFDKSAPENGADLHAIQEAAQTVADRAIACTVGLQVGAAQGSGVIVSEDGYVLTAAHVVGAPGRDVSIRLPDGKVVEGKTLGIHTLADVGLVKIAVDGKWPYLPLVPLDEVTEPGDWCLATGHPSGFQEQRQAPVRVGRVIEVRRHVLQTDCPVTGGDSGGPLLDMQGRVIGIHSRIAADLTENLHGPAQAAAQAWEQLAAGEIFPATPPSRFLDRLDIDRDGFITRAELPAGLSRRVFDRLADKFGFDPQQGHAVDELTKSFGWSASPVPVFGFDSREDERVGERLSRRMFVRGRGVRNAFSDVISESTNTTVAVECDGQRVALGTIVGAEGWIATKASQLKGEAQCELPDGTKLAAKVLDVDDEFDLAVLQVDAQELRAVDWTNSTELKPGSWLVTPGYKGRVASVGVISVAARKIVGTRAMLGVQIGPSEVEARVENVLPNSGAAEAGIRNDDVITHIMDQPVANIGQLQAALQEYRAGDKVLAKVARGEIKLEFDVTLGAPDDMFFRFRRSRMNGPLSRRRDGFPSAIQHDSVFDPTSCGGPVVDVSGKVVGINIARADRIASYAVPADDVKRIVERLRSRADDAAK